MQITIPFIRKNPILQAEFRYQRFVIERGRVGRIWIVLAALLLIPGLITSIVYSGFALANLSFIRTPTWLEPFNSLLNLGNATLLIISLSVYPVVTLITLGLASNSIRREKIGQTWDVLRLTDVDANQLVFGKWWASLRALLGDHIMVTLLRIGLIAYYLVALLPILRAQAGMEPLNNTVALLWMAPLAIVYSVMDAALTTSFGVIATIPDDEIGAIAGGVTIVGRIFMSVFAVGLLVVVCWQLRTSMLAAFALSLAGIGIYALLLLASLFVARWLVRTV